MSTLSRNVWVAILVAAALFLLPSAAQAAKRSGGITLPGPTTSPKIAKILPLALFLVLLVFFFDGQVFRDNLAGGADLPGGESLFQQVQGTMLVTVFVFLGIEGASVYSRYAARRKDVGRATVLGFLSVLSLFASISILSYGILPKAEIAQLQQPSVGGVLEAAVGPWGGTFIRVGLIVAVLGAYLAWQLLAADVLFAAARDHDLPAHLARVNRREVPENAVLWTSVFATAILFAVQFVSEALDFTLDLTAALALTPLALTSAFAVKVALARDGYQDAAPRERTRELVVAVLSTIYTLFLVWAAGYLFLFLACILLAPATILYVVARRERDARLFTGSGLAIFVAVLAFAVVGIVLLANGTVQL